MDEPIIVVEYQQQRQRGLVAYFTWLGLPVVAWLGVGASPLGRAAVVCIADRSPFSDAELDLRGLRLALRLRQQQPRLLIVGYTLLTAERVRGLRQLLAARSIALVDGLGHLDDLLTALGYTVRRAG